ncbi:FHA domain-containing protein [Prochlorothrix hollandica]|uniref:Peptide-binding protein n=1 Tax=Prochlorothrix hollandica PCC 9006 = CALU 1027 TaxID=317619 RepID=A0A0M2Q3G0_PROHO|nr:FHA domain-containing protein [Prochlorothrix hollandica]KKJ01474.1 peptide-binding protein [Prochlorothrix hollandica PCC 9006 = CALU 1027]
MPSAPHQSHLLIIEDDKGRREFILDGEAYSVGRDPRCAVRLVSQFVSRHHATIVKKTHPSGQTYYHIMDGDDRGKPSANGLLINGRKTSTHDLGHQDEVVLGPGVKVTYFYLDRSMISTVPHDEFDITLISPNMMEDLDEDDDIHDEDTGGDTAIGHVYRVLESPEN